LEIMSMRTRWPRPLYRSVLGLVILAGAGAAGVPALAADKGATGNPPQPHFVPKPGEMELSGFLTVRPIQPQTWLARGMNAKAAADRVNAARARVAGVAAKRYPEVDEFVIPVPPGATESSRSGELMATGDYEYVEPDWICYPLNTPNDPRFAEQWHHATIHSELAWEVTPGSAGITIAYADTGVDLTHPDLAAIRVHGYNAPSHLAEDAGGDVSDINGHGTHVSGIGAAIGNNGVGVAGANLNVRFMMCRVSNSPGGGASMSDILDGARWAADHGAKVISCSYSGISSASIQTTGAYIRTLNELFCFAAGNDGANLSGFDYPDVIVVGASDQNDARAAFSAYGRAVDVFAPGVDILSTCNGGSYCLLSGTSMATPLVNGVCGLIWSANPGAASTAVETALYQGCLDMGTPGNDDTYGWGRIDSFGSMRAFLGGTPRAPYAVNDTATALTGYPAIAVDALANDFDLNPGDVIKFLTFDAVSAHSGSISVCTHCGPGGRDLLMYTPPVAFTGTDTFTYTINDLLGHTDVGTVTVTVADPAGFRNPENPLFSRPDVDVDYYALSNPQQLPNFGALTPYASDHVANVNYPSTDGNFATSGRADQVGAVFHGYVSVPAAGFYTFYTNSDDGSRLYIGDTLVVDDDGLHGMQERSGTIALKAGLHAVRVEFFENGGGAGVIASVSAPGLPKQVIAASMLKRDWCPVDWDGNGTVNSTDISAFINSWFDDQAHGTTGTDINGDGVSNSTDVSDLINAYFGPPGNCP
jgi:subtilisin family serine protease